MGGKQAKFNQIIYTNLFEDKTPMSVENPLI